MAEITGAKFTKDIVEAGYNAISGIEEKRDVIMDALKDAAGTDGDNLMNIAGTNDIDISTGAGSLILDNYLQELSTVEQAAAQIVAQANKAQKNVHSQTGQV